MSRPSGRPPADTQTGDLFAHAAEKRQRQTNEAAAYRAERRAQERRNGPRYVYDRNRERLKDIEKIIKGRCGGPATTDDAVIFLRAAIPSLWMKWLKIKTETGRRVKDYAATVIDWRDRWTPAVSDDVTMAIAEEVHDRAMRRRKVLKNKHAIAKDLRVTKAEHDAYDLSAQTGAIDYSEEQRLKDRREKNRLYQLAKRERLGAKPREQSKARTEPWAAIGMKRTKFYEQGLHLPGALEAWMAAQSDVRTSSSPPTSPPDQTLRTSSSAVEFVELSHTVTRPSDTSARRVRGPARDGGWWQHAPAGFAPSVINPASVRQGHAVAQGLPEDEVVETASLAEWRHPGVDQDAVLRDLQAYHGGRLTGPLAILVHDALRARGLSKSELARIIGTKPPQVIRALNGTRGFSQSAASNLKRWLGAAAWVGLTSTSPAS